MVVWFSYFTLLWRDSEHWGILYILLFILVFSLGWDGGFFLSNLTKRDIRLLFSMTYLQTLPCVLILQMTSR